MLRSCKTQEELKSLFRRLAMLLHPDKGGSADLMNILKESYDKENRRFDGIANMIKSSKESAAKISKYDYIFDTGFNRLSSNNTSCAIVIDILDLAVSNKLTVNNDIMQIIFDMNSKKVISATNYNKLVKYYFSLKELENK